MNNEILSKARQLAQIKNEPEGSCDISKLSVALEMADWMKERIISKAIEWLNNTFLDNSHHSVRGFYCEIITHDYDSMEELINDFRKKVTKE